MLYTLAVDALLCAGCYTMYASCGSILLMIVKLLSMGCYMMIFVQWMQYFKTVCISEFV